MPRQARAKATYSAILTAAAHILERGGARAFTTNRVAEKAGVSIGSLYQYFPNKESILVAVAEQAENEIRSSEVLQRDAARDQESPLRLGIRDYINMLPDTPKLRATALETVLVARGPQGVAREVDQRFKRSGLSDRLSDVESFVLSRAIAGVVQSAVREGLAEIKSKPFEDALVDLARAFLRTRSEAQPSLS